MNRNQELDDMQAAGEEIDLGGDDVDLSTSDVDAYSHADEHDDHDEVQDVDDWQDPEPEPPKWDDLEITIEPADEQLYREVTVLCGGDPNNPWYGEYRTARLFFDRKSTGALKRFLVECGGLFGIPGVVKYGIESVTPRLLAECLHKAKQADEAGDVELPEIVGVSLAELASKPPQREYLITDFLPAGVLASLLAVYKGFKTWIGLSIGVAGLTCHPLFGRFAVARPFRTGYFLGEGDKVEAWERLELICKNEGVNPAITRRDLVVYREVPNLTTTAGQARLRRVIQREGFRGGLIQIDPWAFATAGAATSILASMAGIYGDLIAMLTEERVGLLASCHTVRGASWQRGRLKPGGIGDATGVGPAEFSRAWIVASYEKPFNPKGINNLWLQVGGSAGAGYGGLYRLMIDQGTPGNRKWEATCEPAEQPGDHVGKQPRKKPSRLMLDCRKILSTIRELPQRQEGVSALRKAAGNFPVERFDKAIKMLIRKGKLTECNVKKSNRTYPGVHLSRGHEVL